MISAESPAVYSLIRSDSCDENTICCPYPQHRWPVSLLIFNKVISSSSSNELKALVSLRFSCYSSLRSCIRVTYVFMCTVCSVVSSVHSSFSAFYFFRWTFLISCWVGVAYRFPFGPVGKHTRSVAAAAHRLPNPSQRPVLCSSAPSLSLMSHKPLLLLLSSDWWCKDVRGWSAALSRAHECIHVCFCMTEYCPQMTLLTHNSSSTLTEHISTLTHS